MQALCEIQPEGITGKRPKQWFKSRLHGMNTGAKAAGAVKAIGKNQGHLREKNMDAKDARGITGREHKEKVQIRVKVFRYYR